MVNSLDVHFETSRNLLKTAQELNATEGYIFKNLEKDGECVLFLEMEDPDLFLPIVNCVPTTCNLIQNQPSQSRPPTKAKTRYFILRKM